MSGLNAGLPSAIAWPLVSRGIDAFIAVEDERARAAMRALAGEGIVAGECGAAGLAGLTAWMRSFGGAGRGRRALVISTEGATDPAAYRRIVA
jgi:diaminopropionate ammonia-lyase